MASGSTPLPAKLRFIRGSTLPVRILHPDGCETRYAHLQYLYVRPGEVVQAGQTLGTVGQTGRATGAHLHLELWQQGAACDPAALLESAP